MLDTKASLSQRVNETFLRILSRLFKDPAIILVGSYIRGGTSPWKTGKTDFSLMISELLIDMGSIDEVATNIDVSEPSGKYKYIADLETLKYWLHKDKRTKLYIFDEANIHLPSRRAMSNKSVDIIQIFPEISKARARMIVVGQKLESLDSELRHTGWVRGTFEKINLKTVYIRVGREEWTFTDLPPTNIKFDPYQQAPFTLKSTTTPFIDDEELAKLYRWAKGATWRQDFKHQMECNRFVRSQVIKLVEKMSHVTDIVVGGTHEENCDASDQ